MGGTILRFYGGDTAVMRGHIELMGGSPSPLTRENPEKTGLFYPVAMAITTQGVFVSMLLNMSHFKKFLASLLVSICGKF